MQFTIEKKACNELFLSVVYRLSFQFIYNLLFNENIYFLIQPPEAQEQRPKPGSLIFLQNLWSEW